MTTENLMQNETYLDKLAAYYHYHKIDERLLITFIDFVECVQSGRWKELFEGVETLLPKEEYKSIRDDLYIELFVHEEKGYMANHNGKFIEFGLFGNARSNAIDFFHKVSA